MACWVSSAAASCDCWVSVTFAISAPMAVIASSKADMLVSLYPRRPVALQDVPMKAGIRVSGKG